MGAYEQTLGRYRLLRMLGQGGIGQVHLACSHGAAGFEKLVALKVLKPELTSDPKQVRCLQDEAHIAVDLQHQGIVQILDLGEEADSFFIVMEYIRGFSLAKVLSFLTAKDAQLPVELALHLFRASSRALDYVHSMPGPDDRGSLFHGDVSAANLMLGASGRIALGDFGVAALMHQHPEQLAGKWSYVPPEALLGARIDHSWDLFALGALLYEMVTGAKAFPCSSFAERAALPENCLPLREHRPDIPEALAELIESFVSSSPAGRPDSASAMRLAIDEVMPSPQSVEDEYTRYVKGLFGEGDFMRSHGVLPSTTSMNNAMDPFMEATEAPTAQVRLKKPLRFGLTLAHGADRAKGYGEALSKALTGSIERPVRPVLLGDYQTLLDCLLRGDVDIAWMPPLLMAQAAACGAGVLAVAERDGQRSYAGSVIVRADSGLSSIEDLRGKSMAWVDPDSASGYHFPKLLLEETLGPVDDALGRASFHGSHKAVCEAVANGWTDLGATYVVFGRDGQVISSAWGDLCPERAGELRILASTPPIPGDCIAHRPGFSEQWFADLREVFGALGETDLGRELLAGAFRAQSFVDGDTDPYESIAQLL